MVITLCDEGLQQGDGKGIKGRFRLGSRESCLAPGLEGLRYFRHLELVGVKHLQYRTVLPWPLRWAINDPVKLLL